MTVSTPSWLRQLEQDGFVVVPGVVPDADCAEFRREALKWLEKFPHGFKANDRSTWTANHLPYGVTGGLYNRYAVNHEAFVWKIRAQPGIVDIFAKIWGTDDLIASFDGMNVSLPINPKSGRTDIKPTAPWPHIDQDARSVDRFELYQGIAVLGPCGPQDGGLCVMKSSHLKHQEYFDTIGGFRPEGDAGVGQNGYNYVAEDLEWYRQHGCEEVKICANPGDLILWDSRTIHWNSSPTGDQIRFATYVCYCPRSQMSEQELARKLDVFQKRKGTTHWPQMNVIPAEKAGYHNALPRRPDDTVDPANRDRPFVEPEETPMVMRLVGVR